MTEADLTVAEGYAQWARHYDDGFNPLIALEQSCLASIELPIRPSRVLDLATGTGRHALRFAAGGSQVTAIDASAEMLAIARRKADAAGYLNLELVEAHIDESLPIQNDTYDLAVCSLALCHVENLRKVFDSVFKALRPGGLFVVTDLHPTATGNGFGVLFEDGADLRSIRTVVHRPGSYEQILGECGFQIEEVQERKLGQAFAQEPSNLPSLSGTVNWRHLPFCLAVTARKTIN